MLVAFFMPCWMHILKRIHFIFLNLFFPSRASFGTLVKEVKKLTQPYKPGIIIIVNCTIIAFQYYLQILLNSDNLIGGLYR